MNAQPVDPRVGLCSACVHARTVPGARGSRFWLCELSRSDPRYRRYPPLPVLTCAGFEEAPPTLSSGE